MKSLQFRSVNKLQGVFKRNSWLKKLLHQNVNMATILTATTRQSYTVSEKLGIVNYAEQNGNCAAEREFGVSESNVRLWRKSKENLEKTPRLKRANRGKTTAWPELEVDLLSWITKRWMQCMADAMVPWKKPSEELICSWTSEAWHEIPREMIVASFLKCGITNNLDGSEDDLVYEPSEDSAAGLDDSAISELFESESESEFEGFVVWICEFSYWHWTLPTLNYSTSNNRWEKRI